MRNHVERVLKPFDLTGEQAHILKNTDVSTGRSQNELCELVDKTPANITRILDRLEKKKLIIRKGNPDDRRSSLVFQTAFGAQLSASVSKLFERLSTEVEQGLSLEDITIFRNVLTQIDVNLDRLSEQNGE